jgi:3-(3-hydroxy-phenyl)propionate hydroxylase
MNLLNQTPAYSLYPYRPVATQAAARHPVVIIGAGPVGLTLALDLGMRGTPVLVLDAQEGPGQGSRAICFAKRTLEIADRLGFGADLRAKGVVWSVSKVFHGEEKIFEFDLLPEGGHRNPAFVNLQQPHFEKLLVERIRSVQAQGAPIEVRGGNRLVSLTADDRGADLTIDTPDGTYALRADWLVACDGARSTVRNQLGLGFEGRVFEDNFLIADVRMKADFPTQRWFWFDPPFKQSGQSALLHRQPDDIWRLDFQLGWDIDREQELEEANVRRRVDDMLGTGVDYSLEWTSIYTFQCRRMERFRHGRVLFAGDAAHQVSPFGARGANSGIQDADNLGWKLHAVLAGQAPQALLDSYDHERVAAADENILNSTRSTDFITPKSEASRVFRDAVLKLAARHAFARPLVNSGRLSTPACYNASSLTCHDALDGPACSRPGAACPDAPYRSSFLLESLPEGFVLLAFDCPAPDMRADEIALAVLQIDTRSDDPSGRLAERYLGSAPSALYLIRPDRHVAARWDRGAVADIEAALAAAHGREGARCS